MTEEFKGTKKVCGICGWTFNYTEDAGTQGTMCPNCDTPYHIGIELFNLRNRERFISFQKVFSDVSGLLLAFDEVTENTTIGEFLGWLKDELEAIDDARNKQDIQSRLPGLD